MYIALTILDTAAHDSVDGANDNGRSLSKSNGIRSDTNKREKVDPPPNVKLDTPSGPKPIENHPPEKISISRKLSNSDPKLDGSKTLIRDTRISNKPSSASLELKNDTVSRKVQRADKNLQHSDSKADEPDEPPTQPKGHKRGSERPPEAQSRSHGTATSPSRASNQRKVIASTVAKSSAGKPSSNSSKPSVPDKARDPETDSKRKKDNTSTYLPANGDASEKAKRPAKDLPKSSSMSAMKSSHLSKSSHAHVSKKNSTDIKEPSVVSSSKTSSVQKTAATPESGDSANSELSVRGDKISQLNRHLAPKHHPPHVQPPGSTNTPAALSDEELALLLHQELNSSPRVPRVPRMRNAGSLPQLNSPTSTSTLLKRSSTSVGKDNGLVSRKRNKDSANNGPSSSREFDRAKKVDRSSSLPNSRRDDHGKNGSAKVVHPPGSTTASSGRSSSTEHNQTSDDETGAVTHRTLPALLAEIMSKGKRMTYEELCNEVLPHWPNLRKHNGERYAYSSHSQAVLDCLRNRSEWSRLIDRGPKTNAGRKRRKPESDTQNIESEDDYSTDINSKEDTNDYPKGKRKARKQRRLRRGIKDVRRRRKAEVVSDDTDSSSESSEESESSDEEMQEEGTSGPNEASASSDETGS
nr:zinc finger, FYVE/PHD-type [Tanacetum cinerariifolium]GEW96498.1 zinc finger, FYVE/PHD-type [Tanacetum cinerariifolium]